MANRMKRRSIAKQTVEILERGSYAREDGESITIEDALRTSVSNTEHYAPGDFREVFATRDKTLRDADSSAMTRYEVINTTTLAAARTLVENAPSRRVMCLNFASAKNPGGGFLGGSEAQEESLARSTGLHATINGVREYYETNRECGTCLYTDHMIYSPDVPVFRDDRGILLSSPYNVSFITSPAVNAGALAKTNPSEMSRIAPTMLGRIERVLALSVIHNHRALVLGAWGCGVFQNDPIDVAGWFHEHLCKQPTLRGAFDVVVFAVLDKTQNLNIIRPFEERFGC